MDCIRSATSEALEWAKAMCQGEGPNVPLESDKEEESDVEKDDGKKVKFSIYSVSCHPLYINVVDFKLIKV